MYNFRRRRTEKVVTSEKIKTALKSVNKATKIASTTMIYHQAYLEKSAAENNWDLTPIAARLTKQLAADSSDENSEDEILKNHKVSKDRYKQLMKGIVDLIY